MTELWGWLRKLGQKNVEGLRPLTKQAKKHMLEVERKKGKP